MHGSVARKLPSKTLMILAAIAVLAAVHAEGFSERAVTCSISRPFNSRVPLRRFVKLSPGINGCVLRTDALERVVAFPFRKAA